MAMLSIPGSASQSGALNGKVIILDPGHGFNSTNIYRGYNEQAAMLALALKIKPLLEAHGATVHLTRSTSADVSLSTRAALANIWSLEALKAARIRNVTTYSSIIPELNEIDRLISTMNSVITDPETNGEIYFNTPFRPDAPIHPDLQRIFEMQSDPVVGDNFLFISLHTNATGRPINTLRNGADIFHISNNHSRLTDYYTNYSYAHKSRRFGRTLLDHINDTGIRKRSISSANFFMIREHNLPAVLAENGYHTNTGDRTKLMNDNFLDTLALAYLNAIIDYYFPPLFVPAGAYSSYTS